MENVMLRALKNINKKIYKQLYSLNFRNGSPMQKALVKYKNHPDAMVVLSMEKETVNGWSLITPGKMESQIRASFYVRKRKRRKGIGNELLNAVEKYSISICKKWGYFDHENLESPNFFKNCKNSFCVYDTPGLYEYCNGEE